MLGTEFNINTYDSGLIKLSLVTGAARLKTGDVSTDLKPGYEALAVIGEPIKIQAFNKDEALGWHTGVYVFRNKTLQEICPILAQWYKIRITVDTKAILNSHITGILQRRAPLQVFLENMSGLHGRSSYYFGKDSSLHFR